VTPKRAHGSFIYQSLAKDAEDEIMNYRKKAITKIQSIVIAAIIIVAAVVGGTAYYLTLPKTPSSTNEIIIGRILPLTGGLAYEAWMAREAYDVAVDRINAEGGIHSMNNATLRFVDGDSRLDTDTAIAEFEKLRNTYNPAIFMDGWASSMTIAIGTQCDRYKIPVWCAVSMSPTLTQQGWKYFFRMPPLADDYVKGIFDTIAYINQQYPQNKTLKIASVYEATLSGESLRDSVRNMSSTYGLSIVLEQGYDVGTKDFSSLVVQLKAAAPDATLICGGNAEDSALMARQFHEAGFYSKMIAGFSGIGIGTADFINKIGGKEAAKPYYVMQSAGYNPNYQSAEHTWVKNKYFEMHPGSTEIPENWVCFYSPMFVLRDALELSGQLHPDNPLDPESIRDAFTRLNITDPNHPACIINQYRSDAKGDNALRSVVITQIIDGEIHGIFPLYKKDTDMIYPYPTG